MMPAIVAAPLALAAPLVLGASMQAETARAERSDEDALRAFARLSEKDRREVVEYFALEVRALDTYQMRIVRAVLAAQDKDPGFWPTARQAPFFDPKDNAPGQPISRRALSATSSRAREFHAQVFESVPEPKLDSAWRYDYGARGLVRLPTFGDPLRVFRNGLAGCPPDLELAQALVERALDDGSQQKALDAFAHAYTDRSGAVYPGITLYDAWAAGIEIEMPDVDVCGILTTVLGESKKWVAPIPASRHDELYEKIGGLFQSAHRHRGLRRALASMFAVGSERLRDGYAPNLDNLHALWAAHGDDPALLVKVLPDPARWQTFLSDWTARCIADPKLFTPGLQRHATLDQEARLVRAALVRALEELGAFDKATSGGAKQEPPKSQSSQDQMISEGTSPP